MILRNMKDRVKNSKNGFSLSEMLMTVAILVILFAIAVPAVFAIQRDLKQKELDNKAETIYLAVQNRLSDLHASGNSTLYNPALHEDIKALGSVPGDFDEEQSKLQLASDTVHYFVSGSDIADQIVTDETLAQELRNNHWVIEFIPYALDPDNSTQKSITAATVYAVYYSETRNIQDEYSPSNIVTFNQLRFKDKRKDKTIGNVQVGYYGGSNISSAAGTSSLSITSEITSNEEINKAIVKIKDPSGMNLNVTFTLEDSYNNKRTFQYKNKALTEVGNANTLMGYMNAEKVGINYTFTFILDDLSNEDSRFVNLYGENSNAGEGKELVSGSDLILTVQAYTGDLATAPAKSVAHGNSLFAYNSDSANNPKDGKVTISCGRHLQNLDESSGVNKTLEIGNNEDRTAVATATFVKNVGAKESKLSFAEDSDFYKTYSKSYWNGLETIQKINTNGTYSSVIVPKFKGITNPKLTELNGSDFIVSNLSTTGGLFAQVDQSDKKKGITIHNLSLVGERVFDSENAGGVIAYVANSNNVTIENVQVYLSSKDGDIPSAITEDMNLDNYIWIQGTNVGGLVGNSEGNITIKSSSASSVLSGQTVGGLLGKIVDATIEHSYSDSYLYGVNVGGLVGDKISGTGTKAVTISNSYSAGFIGLKSDSSQWSKGAGILNTSGGSFVDTMNNVYTLMTVYPYSSNGLDTKADGISSNSVYFATVENSQNKETNVYYLRNSVNSDRNYGTQITENTDFALGSDFTVDETVTSTPYMLMGTTLSNYKYPKLTDLPHYGDWDVDFEEGILVYYEQYNNDNGSDYGFEAIGLPSSLNSTDKTIITGDGYGVVYRDVDTTIPETTTVNDVTINKSDNYYRVEKDGVAYRIYPLPKDQLNKTPENKDFYTRVEISSSNSSVKKYFDYNPHFAKTVHEVEKKESAKTSNPSEVYIRSPRHLYLLSKYYDSYYKDLGALTLYTQERNLDYASYNWSFANENNTVTKQSPIGRDASHTFNATYNGQSNKIENVSFETDKDYIGMFGYSDGSIKNVVLTTQYKLDGSNNQHVKRTKDITANERVYAGILVGYNNGVIQNTAVAGYYLAGTDRLIKAYQNSIVNLGGFVGYNGSNGQILQCTADSPRMELDMFRSTCYAGGFVGVNEGYIQDSYALNNISSTASEGKTIIAGFVANNTGSIDSSYCATALTSSGTGSSAYAFGVKGEGSVRSSYYLTRGTYYFAGSLNTYDRNDASSSADPRSYKQFTISKGNQTNISYSHELSTAQDASETTYPYRSVVKDASGNYVHYGEWQVKPALGEMGVFYWEKEESGNNNGYKITYLGVNAASEHISKSTLCTAHDDSGIITDYGYGYYIDEDHVNDTLKVSTNNIAMSASNNVNVEAQQALQNQFPGLIFYPHSTRYAESGDYIYMSGTHYTVGSDTDARDESIKNGTITLQQTNNDQTLEQQFVVSPFFGNALAFSGLNVGFEDNPYEIRSIQQLQYLNWNYETHSCENLVTNTEYDSFNYLMYATIIGKGKQTKNSNNKENYDVVFNQTHDINAQNVEKFYPIAGQGEGTVSSDNKYNATLYAWFGSKFNGQSYKIQELNIHSNSFSVGVFGVTVSADIQNTILYSSKNAEIERVVVINRNDQYNKANGAYSLGGLIGVAYDYLNETSNRVIKNCTIAGYKIIDNSTNKLTLGEANVGGLIGVAGVNLENCSAVVDIEINATHKWGQWNSDGQVNYDKGTVSNYGNFIRVGGLCGALQNEAKNCYTGGSMKVGTETLDETYSSETVENQFGTSVYKHIGQNEEVVATEKVSTHVYLAGIAGSGFTMNYQNFTDKAEQATTDGKPKVVNSYTYVQFPKMEGTIRSISMITSVADRFGNSESKATVENCYYWEKSANFEVNLPSYRFVDKGNSIREWGNDSNLFNNMKLGYTGWLCKSIRNTNQTDKMASSKQENRSYSEMSSQNFVTDLGSAFSFVTSVEKSPNGTDQSIPGKYSFPAGNTALAGKNYPFPTVIKQDEYNVHYGSWPSIGAYWQNGIDSLDIFENLSSDGNAYKDFILKSNGEGLNLTKDSIRVEAGEIASVESVTKNSDGDWIVRLKVLRTGTTDVSVRTPSTTAEFTLTVTANLTATSSSNELTLKEEEDADVTLNVLPRNMQADAQNPFDNENIQNSINWNISVSKDMSTDGDAEVTPTGFKGNGKSINIKSYGLNAIVNATVSYEYNSVVYSASTIISVRRPDGIGLAYITKDKELFNETSLSATTATALNGKDTTYASERYKPSCTESSYYLYVFNADEFFNVENLDDLIHLSLNKGPTDYIGNGTVSYYYGQAVKNQNGSTVLPIHLIYRSQNLDASLEGLTLQASVTANGKTYVLKADNVTVAPTPYTIVVHGLGGSFIPTVGVDKSNPNDAIYTFKLTEDVDLNNVLRKTGYNLTSWYTNNGETQTTVNGKLTLTAQNSDMEVYPIWEAKTSTVHFMNGENIFNLLAEYDAGLRLNGQNLDLSNENQRCLGWYTDANGGDLVVDIAGNVNLRILYSLVDQANEFNLYPHFVNYTNLRLDSNGGNSVGYDSLTRIDADVDLNQYIPARDGYQFAGWYDSNNNKLESIGVYDGVNYELTAHWNVMDTVQFEIQNGQQFNVVSFTQDQLKAEDFICTPDLGEYTLPEGYFIEGWYAFNATGASQKIINSDGTVVNKNYFKFSEPKTYELYAKFKKVSLNVETTFEEGKQYLIAAESIGTDPEKVLHVLSSQANGDALSAVSVVANATGTQTYLSGVTDLDSILWTYKFAWNDYGKFKQNDKFLNPSVKVWDPEKIFKLTLVDSDDSAWTYSNGILNNNNGSGQGVAGLTYSQTSEEDVGTFNYSDTASPIYLYSVTFEETFEQPTAYSETDQVVTDSYSESEEPSEEVVLN